MSSNDIVTVFVREYPNTTSIETCEYWEYNWFRNFLLAFPSNRKLQPGNVIEVQLIKPKPQFEPAY